MPKTHTIKVKHLNFLQAGRGLIGARKPEALLLISRFGIHTFGVPFPIDIVILDDKGCIKALKPSLQPNRVFLYNPAYNHVLELPEGTIKHLKLLEGDVVNPIL